jgi:hypothetical protein
MMINWCRGSKVAAAAVAFALSGISSAGAGEVLTFHLVTDANSVQSLNVGDVEGHVLRLNRRGGLALFADGSVGASSYAEMGDYTKGAGTYIAYCKITHSDGSVLWFKVTGSTRAEEATTAFPEAPIAVLKSTGRFAGVSGDGTFKGQLTPFSLGENLYGDVVINLKDAGRAGN